MKKMIGFSLIISLLFVGNMAVTVSAFSVNGLLVDQVDTLNGVITEGDQVELETSGIVVRDLFINPRFPTLRDMYLSTSDGIYLNRQYDADWNKHEPLSELFPDGLTEIKFDGKFYVNHMMLAYSSSNVYMSYDNGDSWKDVTPDTDEEILFADFGPNYSQNTNMYFITATGLYKKSMSSGNVTLLVGSTEPGSVRNFRYVRTQSSPAIFYVVNGDTLLKTENNGDSWFEEKFELNIRDFEIMQKTYDDGHLMVLTEDSDIYYSTIGMTFFQLDLPEEINVIYACDYIILTDQGFYVTPDNGTNWAKLDYDPLHINAISDYDFAIEGGNRGFYTINDNILYRDYNLTETFADYMGDFDTNLGYASTGEVISLNLIDLLEEDYDSNYIIDDAMLVGEEELNGQSIEYYLTSDGENWEQVELNVNHTFENQGRDLRWKAVLSTDDTAVTPVLLGMNVDFGFVESDGCAGFSDIAFGDPDCVAIEYVKAQGIFEGYPDGTFGPDIAINRAETVKVVTEGFDYTILVNDGGDLGFPDVNTEAWYMDYLNTAKTAEIIEGYEDGTFKPEQVVNYAEMIKIFLETAEVPVGEVIGEDAWYQRYVNYAVANDLIVYEDAGVGMRRMDVAKLFYQWSL